MTCSRAARGPARRWPAWATGLGAGILIDAVIVRCLLVPAMVALFGRANWWLPAPVARLLRMPAAPHREVAPVAPSSGEWPLALVSQP